MHYSDLYESNVRSYCRSFPATFSKALGSWLTDEKGKRYIDFLSGAGSLNYGHNNEILKRALLNYINSDGIVHGLDMATSAKEAFIDAFQRLILRPRSWHYKLQFTGPTGANTIEAAFKLARLNTGRKRILSCTNAFHGMTEGALAATANPYYRGGIEVDDALYGTIPYDDGSGSLSAAMPIILSEGHGVPAGIVIETVQGEGGIHVASTVWLQALRKVCDEHGILLIVDDIQMGCGRTGDFFSFERAEIVPDMVTLSKSLSGYGLPFSLVLLQPDLDIWKPGEHNGTFRGHNLAFVTAKAALESYWQDQTFQTTIGHRSEELIHALSSVAHTYSALNFEVRGCGMAQGLDVRCGDFAHDITRFAFESGLIIETSGSDGNVIKCFSPLTISSDELAQGLDILKQSVKRAVDLRPSAIAS